MMRKSHTSSKLCSRPPRAVLSTIAGSTEIIVILLNVIGFSSPVNPIVSCRGYCETLCIILCVDL